MIVSYGRFELDDDPRRIDADAAWMFLSHQAYWARWRIRSDFDQQLATAWRVVGGYDTDTGAMVAFARAISDGVSFAYLADVYVDPSVRGKGLGQELVRVMIEAGPGARMRWTLHTADAHEMYARFGFKPPDETYLERPSARETSTE